MKNIVDLSDNKLELLDFDSGSVNYITYINGEMYFVKETDNITKELVLSEFCHLIGIPCVEYKLAKKNNEEYLVSKSFRKADCKYISGKELIEEFIKKTGRKTLKALHMNRLNEDTLNNLETIWISLAEKYHSIPSKHKDIRNVMVELLKQYFFMILIQDNDFHWENWEIEESDEHISLCPKYDNGEAFGWEFLGVPMGVDSDDPFEKTTDSIKHFINITATEDNELFVDLYNKATPDVLEKAIGNVEEKYDIDIFLPLKNKWLQRYQDQYNRLGRLLQEKGLKR